jgi:PAS domain S-box-containing protein
MELEMKDSAKTKAELIKELSALRRWVADLEASPTGGARVVGELSSDEGSFERWLGKLGYVAYEADASGNITYTSALAEELAGFPVSELIGKPFLPLFTKESQPLAVDVYQRTLRGESPEYELTFVSGRVWRFKNEPMRDEKGRIVGVFGIAKDVTEFKRLGQNLRDSEALYRAVVTNQTELICRFLPDGTLTFVNEAYCRYFAKRKEDLLGRRFMPFIPEEDHAKVDAHFALFSETNRVATHEHRVIGPNGEMRWHQWTNRAILDGHGAIVEFQSVGRDVTERKQRDKDLRGAFERLQVQVELQTADLLMANKKLLSKIGEHRQTEEQLRRSERRFRELADLLPQSVFETDEKGRIIFTNRHGLETSGYTLEDLERGLHGTQLFVPEDRDRVRANLKRLLRGERVGGNEYTALRKDGTSFPVAVYSSPIVQDGQVRGIRGVAIDLTELKKKEDALRESETELRYLYSRVLGAREEERKRVARDLHDGLIQSLATLKMNTKTLLGSANFDAGRAREIMERNVSIASETIEELRKITSGLRPDMLDRLGLIPTLEWYIDNVFQHLHVKVHLQVKGFKKRMNRDLEINMYRIFQEALNNVVRHANAENVWLTLKQTGSQCLIMIEDDGQGFDPEAEGPGSKGQGLLGLKERVRLFDGHFYLDSAPGKGCSVKIDMKAFG